MALQAEKKRLMQEANLARLAAIKQELLKSLEGTDEAAAQYVEGMSFEHLTSICLNECLANESVLEGLQKKISLFVLFNRILHRQQ
ncbi:hypothetical protein ACIQVU_20190 [Lysinibacillus sp. NPDC098008]|uniref:hypothetical protein n=1 Tax=Lysinibacillus sp. NPDC098008 TaxID=3364146 RepID=UPI00380EF349